MMRGYKGKFHPKNPSKYKGDTTNIIYRSLWERKLMSYFDSNLDVLAWASEEIIIPYISPLDDKKHRYFPDFLIKIKNKKGIIEVILIEIKPFKQTQLPIVSKNKRKKTLLTEQITYVKNQAKWEAARAFCKERNWKFLVITEKEIFNK